MKNTEWKLKKGEREIGSYKSHKAAFIPTLAILVLGLLITLIAHFTGNLECLTLSLTFLAVLWLGISTASGYFTTKIEITDQRVLGTQSIAVAKNYSADTEMVLKLEDVVSIGVAQDFLGKRFNYGNIVIRTETYDFQFRNIECPKEIKEKILQLKQASEKSNT